MSQFIETLRKKITTLIYNRKNIALAIIFVHIILCLLAWNNIINKDYDTKYQIFSCASFVLLFFSYVAFIIYSDKRIIVRYCMSTMLVGIFIITDLSKTNTSIDLFLLLGFSTQVFAEFMIQDTAINFMVEEAYYGKEFKRFFYVVFVMGIMIALRDKKMALDAFVAMNGFIILYPLIILTINFKRLKYNIKTLINVFALSIVNIFVILVSANYYDLIGNNELYIKMIVVGIFLSIIVYKLMARNSLINDIKFFVNWKFLVSTILISIFMTINKIEIGTIFIFLLIYSIILKEIDLFYYYKNTSNNDKKLSYIYQDGVFEKIIESSIRNYKNEEVYREKVADFLHDDVLQDIIFMKKEMLDTYNIDEKSKIVSTSDEIIKRIRGGINLYKPNLNEKLSLKENYYNLISYIGSKSSNKGILIDFNCDDDLFLNIPYDILVYRILHEIVVNIYKHSKGYYSNISIESDKQKINILIENYGDEPFDYEAKLEGHEGLSIITSQLEQFNGNIEIEFIEENIVNNIKNESVTKIKIDIPIKGGMSYEDFIDRRP